MLVNSKHIGWLHRANMRKESGLSSDSRFDEDQRKRECWMRTECDCLESLMKEPWGGGNIKKTDCINECIDGETLTDYAAKVSFIHLNSRAVNFIDHQARNERQGIQLNWCVSRALLIPASVPQCDRLISGWLDKDHHSLVFTKGDNHSLELKNEMENRVVVRLYSWQHLIGWCFCITLLASIHPSELVLCSLTRGAWAFHSHHHMRDREQPGRVACSSHRFTVFLKVQTSEWSRYVAGHSPE